MTLSSILSMLLNMIFPRRKDVLLGIRWNDSWLVSFDPIAGSISEWHVQLPGENYRGLTYDPDKRVLYALAQGSKNLYTIHPVSLLVRKIGRIDVGGFGGDVSSIAYNTRSGVLYVVAVNVPGMGAQKSQLFTVDPATAIPTLVGDISVPFLNSISFNAYDGQLYGYALYTPPGDSGAWDSPFKSGLVRIDPVTAALTPLFETPYHTIFGLAKIRNQKRYYTWVNWTAHSYALVDVENAQVSLLANSDTVGVTSDAMLYRNFYVAKRSVL